MNEKIIRIKQLVKELNVYRYEYYNNSNSIISDYEYDMLFDELKSLEEETGFLISDSPTRSVGYEVNSDFPKVEHNPPLLSLDKTQDTDEFVKFCSKSNVLLMHKLDGLTIKLFYDGGKMIKASTRGDGNIGSDITINAKYFTNIPLSTTNKNKFSLTGEAIITKDVFDKINSNSSENKKTPRNLASSIATLKDTSIVKSREIKFVCWNGNDLSTDGTMENGLLNAKNLGFDIVDYYKPTNNLSESVPLCIDELQKSAKAKFIPIDGIVAMYDDIEFGKSLGRTAHHFNNGYAFKFYDEEEETTLLDVEWSMGKTGELSPVAIFKPVEIDGTSVSRALLHNISIIEKLKLGIGDTITVYKANQIIPQIRKNLTKSDSLEIPEVCPICGNSVTIEESYNKSEDKFVKVLFCTNENCSGRQLGLFNHFVSKSAMNIDGLSEATLTKFIELGYLKTFRDIYALKDKKIEIANLEKFGEKSANKLIDSIEKSRYTTLDRLINSLSIPSVGKSTAKLLADYLKYDETKLLDIPNMDITTINGIGSEMAYDIKKWFRNEKNVQEVKALMDILEFNKIVENNVENNKAKLNGINFVVTGKVNKYKSRNDLEAVILHNGGKLQSAVSSTTNYLINNDVNSASGKNKKAKELGISIISEEDFIKMLGDDESATKEITDSLSTPNTSAPTTKNKLF